MAAILVFFCFHANWPLWPHSRLNILLNFTFESEGTKNGGHFGIRCIPHLILIALENNQGRIKLVYVMDGRPGLVHAFVFRIIWTNQGICVMALKLVSLLCKSLKITYSIETCSCAKDVMECQGCKCNKTTSRTTINCQALLINFAGISKELCSFATVFNV